MPVSCLSRTGSAWRRYVLNAGSTTSLISTNILKNCTGKHRWHTGSSTCSLMGKVELAVGSWQWAVRDSDYKTIELTANCALPTAHCNCLLENSRKFVTI